MDESNKTLSDKAINFTAIIAVRSIGVAGAVKNSLAAGANATGQILDKALTSAFQEKYTGLKNYFKSEEGKRKSLSYAVNGAWAVEETFTFKSGLQDGNYYRMGGAILWGVLIGISLRPENVEKREVPIGNNAFEQWKDALTHPNRKRPYFRIAFRCLTASLSAAGGIHYGITEGRYEYMLGSVLAAATFATEFTTVFNDGKKVEFSEINKVEAVGISKSTKGLLATIKAESAKALISLSSSMEVTEIKNSLSRAKSSLKAEIYSTPPTAYASYKISNAVNGTKTLFSKLINEYGNELGLVKGSGGSATLVSEGVRFNNENTVYTGVTLLLARGMEYLYNKSLTGKKHTPDAEKDGLER